MSKYDLDPDLVQVLSEVFADPRARLFAWTPLDAAKAITALDPFQPLARATPSRLTSAERHVVESHRQELALALRWCFVEQFMASEFAYDRFFLYEQARPHEHRTQRLLNSPSQHPQKGILRSCVGAAAKPKPSVGTIISSSLALENVPQAQIYLGHELISRGQPRTALHLCYRLDRQPLSPLTQSYLHQCIASSQYATKQPLASCKSYLRAALISERNGLTADEVAVPALSALNLGLALQNEEALLQATEVLARNPSHNKEVFRKQSLIVAKDKMLEEKASKAMIRRLRTKIDDSTLEYLDALAE